MIINKDIRHRNISKLRFTRFACVLFAHWSFLKTKKLFKDPDFEKYFINPSRWGLFSSGAYFKNQECSDGAYFQSGAYFREGLFSRK